MSNQTQNQQQEKKPAVYRYRCTQACTFQGKYRKTGDIVFMPEKKDIPHFEFIEDKED